MTLTPRRFYTSIDMGSLAILNVLYQVSATDLAGPVQGQYYFNSTSLLPKFYDGSSWRLVGYLGAASPTTLAVGGSAAVGSSNEVSRADHSHAMPGLASGGGAGFMSAAQFTLLSGATSAPTASTLAQRDAAGRLQVADPSAPGDAATKNYVDSAIQGLNPKASVTYATAAALPTFSYGLGVITAVANGALSVDGNAVVVGQAILVKNETAGNAPYNGIYTVTATGSGGAPFVLTRRTDMDVWSEVPGAYIPVIYGSTNIGTGWISTAANTGTIGSTNITFELFNAAGSYTAATAPAATGISAYYATVGNQFQFRAVLGSSSVSATAVGTDIVLAVVPAGIDKNTLGGGALNVANGGTGLTTVSANGMLYGNGTGALNVLTAGAQYQVLQVGAGGAPTWGGVNLGQPAAVTGVLPVSNGGTGASTLTQYGVVIGNGTGAVTTVGPATAGMIFQGNGVGAAPSFVTPASLGIAAKYATTFGDGTSTSFSITHGLGTPDLAVDVYTVSSPRIKVECDVQIASSSPYGITLNFATAPVLNSLRVVVVG